MKSKRTILNHLDRARSQSKAILEWVYLAPTQIAAALAAPLVERYIVLHRNRLAPRSEPLSTENCRALATYFDEAELSRARLVIANPLPVVDLPFQNVLRRFDFHFPGLALTSAITFDFVIAAREPLDGRTLLHELVHTIQYRLLGTRVFARRYTAGFFASRAYAGIPLERCAFELDMRFGQGERFRVEKEVQRWIAAGQF